jgi:hypothetical protein
MGSSQDRAFLMCFTLSRFTAAVDALVRVSLLLELQRLQGDPYLKPYDGVLPGSRLSDVFYSFQVYRRGGNSPVKQQRVGCIRKATKSETYGHARWRLARSGQPIDSQYDYPPVLDRLAISLFCM